MARRWVLLSCVATIAILVLAVGFACVQTDIASDPIPVTIAATTFPASAPVYVAEQQGFYEKHGLRAKVRIYDSGVAAMDAAMEGEADYATAAETPIAQAVVRGRPFSVIATIAQIDEANIIVTSRNHGIESAKDLRGKRVGVTPGTTGDFFLHIYLVVSQVAPGDVEAVELPPNELVGALLSGKVDAISTWSPFTTQAIERLGSDAVVLDQPGLYRMSWNVIRPADPTLSPDVDVRLLRALNDAEEYIKAHPAETRELTSQKCDIPIDDLTEQWDNFRWGLQLDQSLVISLEDEARWMLSERGEPGRQPDFLEHIETDALRKVAPGHVTIIEPGD